ncbi:MAG: hypothetical protein NBV67_18540 [Tagaea sp.]|nr:hypothetical protein [Tagaea sp.]
MAAKELRRLEALEDALDVAILRYRLTTMTKTYTLAEVRREYAGSKKRPGASRRL